MRLIMRAYSLKRISKFALEQQQNEMYDIFLKQRKVYE
nr:MAG TPA_asm: hypothetical protein [Caudoviricetes sp.]